MSDDPTDETGETGGSGAPDRAIESADEMLPLVYAQLRKLANGYLRNAPHTLQPTALVHEAWLRVAKDDSGRFNSRDHFIAVAATAMRQILIDHARRRHAAKRGGDAARVTLDGAALADGGSEAVAVDLLAIHDALTELATLSPRQARIVELQFFGGLTVDEVARVMNVSKSLVEKEWRRARAWIQQAMRSAVEQ